MSQNAGVIGKIIILGGSALAMIGRCASKGDDIFRVGARGFDDVAVVSDDVFRYGDDVLKRSDETMKYFDEVFVDVGIEGAEWFLDEEGDEELEIPEVNLLSDFKLDSVKMMRLGLSKNKYIFDEKSRASFLKILSYSTPIPKPTDPFGKLMLLQGIQTYSMLMGKDWIALKTFQQKNYKYYSLKVDFFKDFDE